jgi:hypothetical protein
MQGTRDRDFTEAFKLAGISKSEATGYTWHHVDDFDPVTKNNHAIVKTFAHEATFPISFPSPNSKNILVLIWFPGSYCCLSLQEPVERTCSEKLRTSGHN